MRMPESEFVAYVGDPDIHDSTIEKVEEESVVLRVHLRTFDGRHFVVEFTGVDSSTLRDPVGKMLYSLSEMRATAPLRRFILTNWEDNDPHPVEVVAREFRVFDTRPEAP